MVHKNLKNIRSAKGITQAYLAKSIGISNMAYSRMESGETKIDVERLKMLSIILDVDVNIFFDEELTDFVIKSMNKKRVVV